MTKKIIDDIISSGKNSIRQISLNRNDLRNQKDSEMQSPKKIRREKTASSLGLWFIVFIVIVFLFFSFSILFSGAKVLVYPKKVSLSLDENISVAKNIDKADFLKYEVMSINKDGSKAIKANGEEYVEEKSSGTITVYNNFDSKDQRLIKNTRFESTDGLIYRIKNSIIVPGIKKINGKTVPGSVDVKVYADEPGEKYNINLSDFTVPGFKGDPRFSKFYARSKTAMEGGFVGNIKILSETDKQAAINEIHSEISKDVLNEIRLQVPSDFILFDDLINISFESLPNSNIDSNTVLITEKAILSVAIVNKNELAKFIAKNKIEKYSGENVEILNLSEMNISVIDKKIDITKGDTFGINIKGNSNIVWTYDEEKLISDLVAKNKSDITSILSDYPGIEKADVVLRPFWKTTLPDNPIDIKIERILDK